MKCYLPIQSMGPVYLHLELISMVNVGKYTIHRSCGLDTGPIFIIYEDMQTCLQIRKNMTI